MLASDAVNLANSQTEEFHRLAQAADSVGCATAGAETSGGRSGTARAKVVNVNTQPVRLNRNDSSNRRPKTVNSILLPLIENIGTMMTYGNTKKMIRPSP